MPALPPLERLVVTYVSHAALKPNSYNPNVQSEHEHQLLLRSIGEDGFTQPVVALRDGTIVDGEHRWRAAQELGLAELPVVYVDMTPEQMRVATLRHNRARGQEDFDLALSVLRDLRELGATAFTASALDVDETEINNILDNLSAPDSLAGERFSDAWTVAPDDDNDGQAGPRVDSPDGSRAHRRTALESARTAASADERARARKEATSYRLALIYSGADAELVRSRLEPHPAEALLSLIRQLPPASPEAGEQEAQS